MYDTRENSTPPLKREKNRIETKRKDVGRTAARPAREDSGRPDADGIGTADDTSAGKGGAP
jgi:hypothetical protein